MGFGVFGLIWLLLIPHYPVLILGPAASFLKAGPLWQTFYVPIFCSVSSASCGRA